MLNDVHIPPLSEDERRQGAHAPRPAPGEHPHAPHMPLTPRPHEVLAEHHDAIDTDVTTYDFNTAYLVAIVVGVFGAIALAVLWMMFL
jgi:hypothetical protein